MRIDRDAAAVVDDRDVPVGVELDFDEGRMAGQRLVHGVVDHFGEQMVQRFFVGAADIHAGAAAHRFEPFEHLDVLGGIAGFARRAASRAVRISSGAAARRGSGTAAKRSAPELGGSFLAVLGMLVGPMVPGERRIRDDYATVVAGP